MKYFLFVFFALLATISTGHTQPNEAALTYQVDVNAYHKEILTRIYWRVVLRYSNKLDHKVIAPYPDCPIQNDHILISLKDAWIQGIEDLDKTEIGHGIVAADDIIAVKVDNKPQMTIGLTNKAWQKIDEQLLMKITDTIRFRLEMSNIGIASIEQVGTDRLRFIIDNSNRIDEVKKLLQTGKLTMHYEGRLIKANPDSDSFLAKDFNGNTFVINKFPIMTGKTIIEAKAFMDSSTSPPQVAIHIRLDKQGAKTFRQLTQDSIGKRLIILIDDRVVTAPTINSEIPNGQLIITGDFDIKQAQNLATILEKGSFPTPITLVEVALIQPL